MAQAAPVPRSADLIRSFVNTRDVEADTDALDTPAGLADWLRANHVVAGELAIGEGDRELAVALREALRQALMDHHESDSEHAAPDLEAVARDLPLRLACPPGGPRLEAVEPGVRGALASIVAEVHQSVSEGSWSRLKACPADDCSWAFYDASRNRSRTWCSMQVCGNRAKTRTFRTRHAVE
jgi:predicted RNA-binding Zn ribbon-like protein